MGKSQRTKGAVYEREVCDVLTQKTGRKIQRHIGQARDGGNDITVGSLVVECKRRKTLGTVESWLQQAKDAQTALAADDVRDPYFTVVIARSDGGKSMAIMPLDQFLDVIQPSVLVERMGYKR